MIYITFNFFLVLCLIALYLNFSSYFLEVWGSLDCSDISNLEVDSSTSSFMKSSRLIFMKNLYDLILHSY